jgi:hypothetical protein
MRAAVLLLGVLGFGGCASGPQPAASLLVPVSVECREPVPDRPAMPTEKLLPGVEAWILMRAALAELDRREAYEAQLRAGLLACVAPLATPR